MSLNYSANIDEDLSFIHFSYWFLFPGCHWGLFNIVSLCPESGPGNGGDLLEFSVLLSEVLRLMLPRYPH